MIKKYLKKFPQAYNYGNDILLNISRFIKVQKLKYKIKNNRNNLKIVIGASGKYCEGWIPTEIEYFNILKEKHWEIYFQKDSIDAILAEHVWEHLTENEGKIAAKLCNRYLKKGGYIRLAVPDGNHPDKDYIDRIKPGGNGQGSENHKMLFDYKSLSDLFEKAGFNTSMLEYFDSSGVFCHTAWDDNKGIIERSARRDRRNINGSLIYTSIIMDAYKNN